MGSIEYCAPEQIRGEEVDGRADVYSLGCVLFEAIAGRPPFKRETEIATLYAHLEQTPPALSSVASTAPRDLDGVVSKALAKRPSGRYPTPGAFARDARHATGVGTGERETVRRRTLRWGVVVGVLAMAAVLGAIAFLTGGNGPVSTPDRAGAGPIEGADTVVRLDPETSQVVQSVGGFSVRTQSYFSNGLAVGEGGVWVGSGNAVTHVDPVTGTIRATISIIGARQTGITLPAVAFRTVWVSTGAQLQRINPATDALLKPISVFPVVTSSPGRTWIATGEDRVWVAAPSALVAVDPVRGRVVLRVDVPDVTGLAVGEGSVWILDDLSSELLRFDPATGKRTGAVSVPGNLDAVVAGGGAVWILDKGAGTVVLVDPDTMEVTDTVRVGSGEQDIAFGGSAVWLADGQSGSVTRLDPLTRQLTEFHVGGPARLVGVGADPAEVWALILSAASDEARG
jgi:streptogramin lyase